MLRQTQNGDYGKERRDRTGAPAFSTGTVVHRRLIESISFIEWTSSIYDTSKARQSHLHTTYSQSLDQHTQFILHHHHHRRYHHYPYHDLHCRPIPHVLRRLRAAVKFSYCKAFTSVRITSPQQLLEPNHRVLCPKKI